MVCNYYRLGTHISGVVPVTRQMRINNSSPFGKIKHILRKSTFAMFVYNLILKLNNTG